MVRYFIQFGYIGTRFRGVQSHSGPYEVDMETIAGMFETALQKFRPNTWPMFYGSSRTDSGVHALSTACHVDLVPENEHAEYDPSHITVGLNRYFEKSDSEIRVHRTVIVPDTFSARHDAVSREYLYRVAVLKPEVPITSLSKNSLVSMAPLVELNRSWVIPSKFDAGAVKEAMSYLVGTWDFTSFAGANSERSPIRCLLEARLSEGRPLMDPKYDPLYNNINIWDFNFLGLSFVYRQVRRMVGALVAVGQGIIKPEGIKSMLENPSQHSWISGLTSAPAYALYLVSVNYAEGTIPSHPVTSPTKECVYNSDSDDEQ